MSEVKTDLICEAGALVEYDTEGHGIVWGIVEAYPSGEALRLTVNDKLLLSGGADWFAKYSTVLLPPRPADPAEALRCLAALPGAIPPSGYPFGSIEIQMETGKLWAGLTSHDAKSATIYCEWWFCDIDDESHQTGTADNYAARGRDHAKEGALRSWLAQPAKEVAE
jgi:hypothetical protein